MCEDVNLGMAILESIQLTEIRNIRSCRLSFSPKINIFFGENGSGKTTLLESISLLGLGKSFRTRLTDTIQNHNAQTCIVFAEILHENLIHRLGFEKRKGALPSVHLNGQTVKSNSTLASLIPLQILNSDSFNLIEGPPTFRRRFLDWLAYYSNPQFNSIHKRFYRALKQRNYLLKLSSPKNTVEQLRIWDHEFLTRSIDLNEHYRDAFSSFSFFYSHSGQDQLLNFSKPSLTYDSGWPDTSSAAIHQVLDADFDRDVLRGYTHHGPHRRDIKISYDTVLANDYLSKGQIKSVCYSLLISQVKFLSLEHHRPCILLVDDLFSELDDINAKIIASWIEDLDCQVFITGLCEKSLLSLWTHSDIAMFHVEHGNITPINH